MKFIMIITLIVFVFFNAYSLLISEHSISYNRGFIQSVKELLQCNFIREKEKIKPAGEQYLFELQKKLDQSPDSSQLRNYLAIHYVYQNEIEKAEKHWQYLLTKDSTNFHALNNIGNLFFMKGNLDSAETYYLKALDYASGTDQDGIYLNLGLVYAAADSESLAVDIFAYVMRDSTDYQKIGNLLGIKIENDDLVRSARLIAIKEVSSLTIKQLTDKAIKKKKRTKKKSGGVNSKRPIGKKAKGARIIQSREEIENVFYWAY